MMHSHSQKSSSAVNENVMSVCCLRFALGVCGVLLLHFTFPSGSWSVAGREAAKRMRKDKQKSKKPCHVFNT